MKPFKINRNSWHYKLNQRVLNENEHWMEKWDAKNSNFCSYWRATLFRLIWVAMVSAVLLMMLIATIMNPMQALYVFLVVCAIIASVIGGVLANEYFEDRREGNAEPKTLIGKQYAAYKSKICPSVEFD